MPPGPPELASGLATIQANPSVQTHLAPDRCPFFNKSGIPQVVGLPAQIIPAQQPTQSRHPCDLSRRFMEWVNPVPALCRGLPVQMLMRTKMVVPQAKLSQARLQITAVLYRPAIQLMFQCPEEAFHSTVLPRVAGQGALMANAQQTQSPGKHFPGKSSTIIGAYGIRFTIAGNTPTAVLRAYFNRSHFCR